MIKYTGYQYNCSANESFDSIALRLWRDEKYAPDLMNANPEYCGQTVFLGGEALLIPEIETPSRSGEATLANTIAPWRM
ncbi:MAG: phage tail protein [Clostridia bacterium]|nr:phage tail protein [Clostridia bacterium]